MHSQNSHVQWVEGPIIVGAGPSGLATAACLQACSVPYLILERADCIASLWKLKTYDRLHLHIAKQFCELPLMPFPKSYPIFLTRQQFVDYLEDYAKKLKINPRFTEKVQLARFDEQSQTWRVWTSRANDMQEQVDANVRTAYASKWLIVATGENAEAVQPKLPGLRDFKGKVIHSREYKNGSEYANKRVLVVGSGNSGMEIALDLANCNSTTNIVVRSPLHVLPRKMFGKSTFSMAMELSKFFPIWLVDYFLVAYSQLRLGDTAVYGLRRPKIGPLELKNKMGKTPILDVGTLSKIQSGDIKVRPGIECLTTTGARFVDGTSDNYDAIILATGYKSVVPTWLDDEGHFFTDQGLPALKRWKGERGLYAAGFSGKGLLGATMDARQIAQDLREAHFSGQSISL